MRSVRSLTRDLKNIVGRMVRNEERGMAQDRADLLALKETVDLLIERLKEEPHEG